MYSYLILLLGRIINRQFDPQNNLNLLAKQRSTMTFAEHFIKIPHLQCSSRLSGRMLCNLIRWGCRGGCRASSLALACANPLQQWLGPPVVIVSCAGGWFHNHLIEDLRRQRFSLCHSLGQHIGRHVLRPGVWVTVKPWKRCSMVRTRCTYSMSCGPRTSKSFSTRPTTA